MQQIAKVNKIINDRLAEVTVERGSACGGSCASCGGCDAPRTIVNVVAVNSAGAAQGDTVIVESSTRRVLGIAGLVYLVPILFFFLGYLLCGAVTASETAKTTVAVCGFFLGIAPAAFYGRIVKKSGGVSFEISSIRQL